MSTRSVREPGPAAFLNVSGELGRRIAAFDWAGTPLGPIGRWPASLRVALSIMLGSGFPMVLWWGEERLQFHNDAFGRIIARTDYPTGLGMSAADCWPEFWPTLGPMAAHVMAGNGSIYQEDQLLDLVRNGRHEDAYVTICFSPVHGDTEVDGVLVMIIDVTQQHFAVERSEHLSAGLLQLFKTGPDFVSVVRGPDHVFEFVNENYKALMGDRDFIGKPVREVVPEVADQGFFELLDNVYRTGRPFVSEAIPMRYQPMPGGPMVEVMLKLSYQALTDPNGEIFGIFVEGHTVDPAASRDPAKLTAADMDAELSARESEVLRWTAAGKTAAEIAKILGISDRTVEFHITSAARKLDTVNRVQTVVEAIRKKLISV